MKSDQEMLEMAKKIFPGLEGKVQKLFEQDADFRSLCSDYYNCLRDLHKYRKLSEAEKQTIKEYESVCEDLEKELFDFLIPSK